MNMKFRWVSLKSKVSDRDVERIDNSQSTAKPKRLVRATSAVRRSNAHSELDLRGQRYDEAMTNLDRYIDFSIARRTRYCNNNSRYRYWCNT